MRVSTTTRTLGDRTRTVAHLTDGKQISVSVVVDGRDKEAALDALVETLQSALGHAVAALVDAERSVA